ncbi:hypothetical protein L207DRAFT_20572 [Hyaloscypha variabilis F]|uniref:C2H2-type domain-containing protein n=1 Tax=Hyaloscypha variabilis (strain UAMH 11265 / GT02V1 / F) TaxID=1149755 RepID=A0A2J6SE58_HYAVF|nr:hypothetical protein L207DRAFT_20572 [Hyaloscypha variabilis F]
MKALLGNSASPPDARVERSPAFVRSQPSSSFPFQVSYVFHTILYEVASLVLVGDKDLRRFGLDIKPCQMIRLTIRYTSSPNKQCQQRRLAKSGYILWAGPRRRHGECLAGNCTSQLEGSDAGEDMLEGGGRKRPLAFKSNITSPNLRGENRQGAKSAARISSSYLVAMDFNPESAQNQQTELWDGTLFNAHSLAFHHSYPQNYGVAVPGFFVPFPSYTMYPNAAVEQLVPIKFSGSHSSGVCEDWTGHQSVSPVSSQIQGLQLNANSEHDFDPAPQFETRYSYATPAQQDWSHETALHYANPNEVDLPQAGIVVQASSGAHSHYNTTEQQDWYNQSSALDSLPTGFDFASQDNANHNPAMKGFVEDASANLFHSDGASEETHFSGHNSFDTSNTETTLSFNAPFQPSTSTYETSSPLQDMSTHSTIASNTHKISFSSTSPTSPTPSPTNASSPTSTRHPCPHCPSTFARPGDLKRHMKSHFPERHRQYHCREPGCDRNGRKAFTRRDKWRDHVRGVHGLEED